MVGGDDVEHVVAHRIQQGVLVGGALHRRVALDLAAQGVVVRLVEEQMMDAHLGGDVLVFQLAEIMAGGKQRQLLGGHGIRGLPQGHEYLQQTVSGRVVVHSGLLQPWCMDFPGK